MEKFYSYFDIIFLIFIVVFLLFVFIRLLGKKRGIQRSDLEVNKIPNVVEDSKILKTAEKNNNFNNIAVDNFASGSLNYKLNQIKEKDSDFELKKFLINSKKAFELIVTNFNKGNLSVIEPFLTKDVFDSFSKFKQSNQASKEVNIEDFLITDVIDAEINNDIANIKVKFLTKQKINNQLKEINEVWVFNKNIVENTSIWKLSGVNYG
ncbi:Tim44/TimA family putative adaptor protein [Rickettsiales bacterium LUAb2]